jgi:hypothetical protein
MRSSIIQVNAADESELSEIPAAASAMLNFHASESWFLMDGHQRKRRAGNPAREPQPCDKDWRGYRPARSRSARCCQASIQASQCGQLLYFIGPDLDDAHEFDPFPNQRHSLINCFATLGRSGPTAAGTGHQAMSSTGGGALPGRVMSAD